uniref:Uncharacterized protein n=1 Tax=Timema genevievae TaxID=629358 RepID=A0A7R9PKF8_TIMGE|nr:unnamed protein product [Timema genevievae]
MSEGGLNTDWLYFELYAQILAYPERWTPGQSWLEVLTGLLWVPDGTSKTEFEVCLSSCGPRKLLCLARTARTWGDL